MIKKLIQAGLLWLLLHTLVICYFGIRNHYCSAELGVVLGSTVYPDGSLSPALQCRLDCAYDLYNMHRIDYILVSGALGREGYPEGDKMQEYLIARGIPANKIIVDNEGVNTRATARNAARLCRENGYQSAIAISQYFHLARCQMLFEKAGVPCAGVASPAHYELRDVYSLVREFAAFYTQCW